MAKKQTREKNIPPKQDNLFLNYTLYISFFILLIFFGITKISGEDDFFWHLASGRYIVEHKSIPTTDVFGYVTNGQQWIPFEWGWDTTTYLIFNSIGYTGTYIFKILLILIIFFIFLKILDKLKFSTSLNVVFLLILCWGMLFRFSIRPHLISYLGFALLTYIFVTYKYINRKNYKVLYYLPLIFLFWANFHMGVIAGLLFFGVFLASETIIYLFPHKFSSKEIPPAEKKDLIRLFVVFLISLIVMLINPNNIKTYEYVYAFSQFKLVQDIGEWKSPFDSSYSSSLAMITYKIFLVLGVFILYYSYKKKDLYAFLIFVIFLLYSIRATRFTTDYNIITSVFIFMGINYIIENIKSPKIRNFINIGSVFKLIVLILILFQVYNLPNDKLFNGIFNYYRKWGVGTDKNFIPQEMFDFAKSNKINEIGAHTFNSYTCGGLYSWVFPQSKNFIDSRFLNDEIYSEYSNIYFMHPGFKEKLKQYDVDYFMLVIPNMIDAPQSVNRTIVSYLNQNNNEWKLVYWNDVSLLYVRNISKFDPIISKFEYKYLTPYNIIFQKAAIDKALNENRDVVVNEIKRKLSEEPDGLYINTVSNTYRIR